MKTYRVRRFPFRGAAECLLVEFFRFNCDNWLALVLGSRGDGFPVPGRMTCGLLAPATRVKAIKQNTSINVGHRWLMLMQLKLILVMLTAGFLRLGFESFKP